MYLHMFQFTDGTYFNMCFTYYIDNIGHMCIFGYVLCVYRIVYIYIYIYTYYKYLHVHTCIYIYTYCILYIREVLACVLYLYNVGKPLP